MEDNISSFLKSCKLDVVACFGCWNGYIWNANTNALVFGYFKRNNELERIPSGIVLYVEQLLLCTTLSLMEVTQEVNRVLDNVKHSKQESGKEKQNHVEQ